MQQLQVLQRKQSEPLRWHDLEAVPGLYPALLRHLGSLDQARRAARIPFPPRHRKWTEARILDDLREAHRQGIHLSLSGLAAAGRSDLASAATYWMGSLARARSRARLPEPSPRSGTPRVAFSPEEIRRSIRAHHAAHEPLAPSRVDSALRSAGEAHFGSWRDAVEACGIDYDAQLLRPQRLRAKDLLEELRALAKARPDLSLTELNQHRRAPALWTHFGSPEKAARAAGLKNWPRRRRFLLLPRRGVLAVVRTRARAHLPMHSSAVRQEDPHLFRSAERHFGGWERAVTAAGVAHQPLHRAWTAERVVAALRRWAKEQGPGAPLAPGNGGPGSALYQAARRHFGSLQAAQAAAGVRPTQERWTRERVLEGLGRLPRGSAVRGKLRSAAVRCFGSVTLARAALDTSRRPPRPR